MQTYIANIVPICTKYIEGLNTLVIYFAGCNFRCPYCFLPDYLHLKEEFIMRTRGIKEIINNNKLFIEGVVFSGGEPTLYRPVLLNLARFIKSCGLKTILETNGSKPDVLLSLLREKVIDHIILDIKCPLKNKEFKLFTKSGTFFKPIEEIIKDVKRSIEILKKYDKIIIEITTVYIPELMDYGFMYNIAKEIVDIKAVWVIKAFINHRVYNKKFKEYRIPSKKELMDLRKRLINDFPQLKIRIKNL